jgi:hypothetical protein
MAKKMWQRPAGHVAGSIFRNGKRNLDTEKRKLSESDTEIVKR